jgi:hypothetical protein
MVVKVLLIASVAAARELFLLLLMEFAAAAAAGDIFAAAGVCLLLLFAGLATAGAGVVRARYKGARCRGTIDHVTGIRSESRGTREEEE